MANTLKSFKGLNVSEKEKKKNKAKYEIGTSVRIPSLAVVSRSSATAQTHLTNLLKYGGGYARKNAAEPTKEELRPIELNPENYPVLVKPKVKVAA